MIDVTKNPKKTNILSKPNVAAILLYFFSSHCQDQLNLSYFVE